MALPDDLNCLEELINGLNYVTMLEVHDAPHDSAADSCALFCQLATPVFVPLRPSILAHLLGLLIPFAWHREIVRFDWRKLGLTARRADNMVFTLRPFGHTLALWQRAMALVQSFLVQTSLASFKAVS